MKTIFTKRSKLLIVISFLSGFNPLIAQSPPQIIVDSLQNILDQSVQSVSGSFANAGVIMRVVSPGLWGWEGASGYAISGMTSGQPQSNAQPDMLFRVGSITKTMVATCILKLEQQGMLSIEDPVNLYLRPTLVNDTLMPSDTLRIRHLLNHTSGIPNSADNTSCQADVLNNPLGAHSLEEAIYCGASQGEIFSPGIIWVYSNTNYSILAMIIENVTGQTYQQFITQNLFMPLNLNNTLIPTSNQMQQPHMGCYWNIGSWIDLTIINPTTYTGWADVVSTTDDLITFYSELLAGNIINSTELAIMKTIDPASFDYGMGLDFYTFLNSSYYGHYGEVANTSGLYFADISSPLAPNGYFIAYDFNVQGVDMQNDIDIPVLELLKNITVSLPEIEPSKFVMYPNPAKNSLTINTGESSFKLLVITDIQGRVVLEKNLLSSPNIFNIDVENINKGIYIVTLLNDKTKRYQKLIKE